MDLRRLLRILGRAIAAGSWCVLALTVLLAAVSLWPGDRRNWPSGLLLQEVHRAGDAVQVRFRGVALVAGGHGVVVDRRATARGPAETALYGNLPEGRTAEILGAGRSAENVYVLATRGMPAPPPVSSAVFSGPGLLLFEQSWQDTYPGTRTPQHVITQTLWLFHTAWVWLVLLLLSWHPLWRVAQAILRVWGAWCRWRAVRRGLCPVCRYDIRATPQRCPECGSAIPAYGAMAPYPPLRINWWILGPLLVPGAILCAAHAIAAALQFAGDFRQSGVDGAWYEVLSACLLYAYVIGFAIWLCGHAVGYLRHFVRSFPPPPAPSDVPARASP